ncbi:outer membrane pore protein [Escherichia coli]|nr:outer membrane pore protein [Escherichia coli]GDJ49240.1 outer membrane pore protein [Escherichia coli]GDJ96144.1 outer membrane pore protein [Escherichia coli]GDK71234.1 outer membrane pore protein [Escherichia coli]GDK91698.1 outer membrane pore protein [Escherichia coli]
MSDITAYRPEVVNENTDVICSTSIRRWICPYISRHLLSLNPLQARCRRYSRGER